MGILFKNKMQSADAFFLFFFFFLNTLQLQADAPCGRLPSTGSEALAATPPSPSGIKHPLKESVSGVLDLSTQDAAFSGDG